MAKAARPKGASLSHYDVLEVSRRASQEVIKAAYRALMSRHHPDQSGGSNRVAQQLNEAYETLTDVAKRAKYDEDSTRLVGTMVGNYRVIEEIAEGGFGVTYRGEQPLVKESVCIKHCLNVSPQDEEILVAEAKAAWDLRHYAIPTMRDLVRMDDGSLALVMSYVPGPTIEQIVERTGARIDPEHVAWIIERVLNGLKYMHMHGVVHGDVKPQNIIVQPEKHMAVLVDFGLAMVKPTAASASKGFTPLYAPPEEMEGRPLLPESDFYSLGMTMLYALSGGHEHVQRLRLPTDVPEPLRRFVKRLIVRDVLSRPNWEKEDLCETIRTVRMESFGRTESRMKELPVG